MTVEIKLVNFHRAILRVFLFLIAIEIFLRLGGVFFTVTQDFQNRLANAKVQKSALNKNRPYTILCMGDSITGYGGDFSYPRQLQRLLNEKYGSTMTFNVINRGIPGRPTLDLISYLNYFLEEDDPDMVIVMMGILDHIYKVKESTNFLQKIKMNIFKHIKLARVIKNCVDLMRPDLKAKLLNDTIKQGLWAQNNKPNPVNSQAALEILNNNSPEPLGKEGLDFSKGPQARLREEAVIHLHPLTQQAFKDFSDTVLKHNKKLVIMQYPLISIAPLRKVLASQSGIIFVENVQNFQNELKHKKPEHLFADSFGYNFGHCTDYGASLMVAEIERVLAKELFHEL